MLVKRMTYTDFDGNERTEDFRFNLTRAEVMMMELSIKGGLVNKIQTIVAANDGNEIMAIFRDFILKSYGEKSPDGKHFVKSEELSKAFSETEAYSDLFWSLVTDPDAAAAFVNAIIPNVPDVSNDNRIIPPGPI